MILSSFATYVIEDALSHLSGITIRAMFGGYGIYKDGYFFAIMDEDSLYFKVDETNKNDYEELESYPFSYIAKGKKMQMNYFLVPEEILEQKEKIGEWVEKSVSVAKRNKKV